MSQIYRLRDSGFDSYKIITKGRVRVGRVARHSEGGFVGVIGNDSVRSSSEVEAFEEISARAMGYGSAAALKNRNRAVRAVQRQRSQVIDAVGRAFLSADVKTQMNMIDKIGSTPDGASLLIAGVTRSLKRSV